MGLREAYECEFDTKHLIDVVQTKPMPTWGYVEWLEERLLEAMESPANSPASPVQQLKAEIRAICIELECTSYDKFDCGMYHALRGRLRELSAV